MVTCSHGFTLDNNAVVVCDNGLWNGVLPLCVKNVDGNTDATMLFTIIVAVSALFAVGCCFLLNGFRCFCARRPRKDTDGFPFTVIPTILGAVSGRGGELLTKPEGDYG